MSPIQRDFIFILFLSGVMTCSLAVIRQRGGPEKNVSSHKMSVT